METVNLNIVGVAGQQTPEMRPLRVQGLTLFITVSFDMKAPGYRERQMHTKAQTTTSNYEPLLWKQKALKKSLF